MTEPDPIASIDLETSSKSAWPAKDFESCETVRIAESAQCCLVRCPAQLASHAQPALYAKSDVIFPIYGASVVAG